MKKEKATEEQLPSIATNTGVTTVQSELRSLENIEHIKAFAKPLREYILANKLTSKILEKEWVNIEGWQFAGSAFGIVSRTLKCTEIVTGKENEICYEAEVELINLRNSQQVGKVSAICSNQEPSKKYYQRYAIHSMAITRASGKAFRMMLGFIMKDAGFEVTPADEMDEVGYENDLMRVKQDRDAVIHQLEKLEIINQQIEATNHDLALAVEDLMRCESVEKLYEIHKAYPRLKEHKPFINLCKLRKEVLTVIAGSGVAVQVPKPIEVITEETQLIASVQIPVDETGFTLDIGPMNAGQKSHLVLLANQLKVTTREMNQLLEKFKTMTATEADQQIHHYKEMLAIKKPAQVQP
jgi:hypothetical protein